MKKSKFKSPYALLWLLLATALVVAIVFSFNERLSESLGLKRGTFAEVLTKADDSKKKAATDSVAQDNSKPARRPGSEPVDTTSKNILFLGDSMLEGLGPRLAAYSEENGHKQTTVIWYSSSTEVWGSTKKIKEYINEFKPDYIFICLGANELFVRDIKENRQKFVDEMLKQIGDIPYVWIGPPNWKPDTGINDMISSSVAPGCFYLSYTPDQYYQRAKDGAHPTRSSAAAWMDRVCKWVMTKSAYPIKLNRPSKDKAHCKTVTLQPVR